MTRLRVRFVCALGFGGRWLLDSPLLALAIVLGRQGQAISLDRALGRRHARTDTPDEASSSSALAARNKATRSFLPTCRTQMVPHAPNVGTGWSKLHKYARAINLPGGTPELSTHPRVLPRYQLTRGYARAINSPGGTTELSTHPGVRLSYQLTRGYCHAINLLWGVWSRRTWPVRPVALAQTCRRLHRARGLRLSSFCSFCSFFCFFDTCRDLRVP